MIGLPPVSDGAFQTRVAVPLPRVALRAVGRPAGSAGIAAGEAGVKAPRPAAFTAAIRKAYDVPLARPLIVAAVAAEAPSATVFQWAPPSVLDSTT